MEPQGLFYKKNVKSIKIWALLSIPIRPIGLWVTRLLGVSHWLFYFEIQPCSARDLREICLEKWLHKLETRVIQPKKFTLFLLVNNCIIIFIKSTVPIVPKLHAIYVPNCSCIMPRLLLYLNCSCFIPRLLCCN